MKKISLSAWWMNFLTGVLATSIGVGLTFGVNNLVTRSNQKQAQRQAAMMAIYDIDEMARKFDTWKAREDAFFHVTMYLFTHPEELQTTSMDSLWMVSSYLHFDPATMPEWVDESTEKVFTTSMDAMTHVGDIAFYRNVQECYHQRRDLLNKTLQSATFRKPITDQFITDYRKNIISTQLYYGGMMNPQALAGCVRLMFEQPEVELYLQKFHSRNNAYDDFISQIRLLNRENQFIMNISDEDMKRYVDTYVSKIVPATPKLLAGEWELTSGPKTETYDLREDHTITYTMHTKVQMSLYLDEESLNVSLLTPMAFTTEGQWDLLNDTLLVLLDSATTQMLTFDMELSSLPKSYTERYKDSLELMKDHYRGLVCQSAKERVSIPDAHKVSISKTGNIMFWEVPRRLPWGEIYTDKQQLTKTSE